MYVFSGGCSEWGRSIWMLYVVCKETVHLQASCSGRVVGFKLKDTGQVKPIISVHFPPPPHAFCLILIIIPFEFILFY